MSAAAWEAFVINSLFWSGIAIGAVVFSALVELTGGQWAGDLRVIAERFRRFLPISLVVFGALAWRMPAVHARSIAAVAATYIVAFWFARSAPQARSRAAVTLLVAYVAAFSLVAHDVIMSLEPGWTSTLFPAYAVTANVYGAVAAVTLASVFSDRGRQALTGARVRDASMVLVGFGLLWLYLVWCQFLVIWYGDVSEEAAFVVKRAADGWRALGWVVFAARCAVPLPLLLLDGGRHRALLVASGALVLAGFWIETLLLVGPAMPGVSAGGAAALTGLFGAAFAACVWRPRSA